jgi:hypothetical protein
MGSMPNPSSPGTFEINRAPLLPEQADKMHVIKINMDLRIII